MSTYPFHNIDRHPSQDCLTFLHAEWKHAGYFVFTKHGKIRQNARKNFVKVPSRLQKFLKNRKQENEGSGRS